MTIGTELRQAREQRGVSLREISERTQIRLPVLRAIESDDFQRLPRGVITRGFLKLYAREIDLDPDEILKRYAAQAEPAELEGPDSAAAATPLTSSGFLATPVAASRTSARTAAVVAVAALAVAAVGYLAWRPSTGSGSRAGASGQQPAEVAAPEDASSASKPGGAETGTTTAAREAVTAAPSTTAPAAKEAAAGVLRIDLRATGPVWVSATADGQQVLSRQMDPGERLTIRVTDQAVLRIGLPGNLTVLLNDKPVRPFERPGTPITLRISAATYRDLLLP